MVTSVLDLANTSFLTRSAVPSCLHALRGGEKEPCSLCYQREACHGKVSSHVHVLFKCTKSTIRVDLPAEV